MTATNGVEALKVLEGHTVNLIVSDIMMPEMDGLELCDRINQTWITVIFLLYC